jgi:hypothetical protein
MSGDALLLLLPHSPLSRRCLSLEDCMTRAELRWAIRWSLAVMVLTCLPYLYVAQLAPPGTTFSGLMYAADDHCVYLSWEQQAAEGRFFLRNLFTGDAQRGIYVHLLSWLIGTVARFTGLPLILVHHGARVLAGFVLLLLVYALAARFTTDLATRRVAFWFTALSAGVGFLFLKNIEAAPNCSVDLWQPEAVTFLCLYINGLFCVALALMLGIFLLLLAAEQSQGGPRWWRVFGAGLLGLLLGNIHSYDVITVVAVWVTYLIARALESRRTAGTRQRSGPGAPHSDPDRTQSFALGRSLVNALVAGLVALPGTAYQYYLYRTEPVFRMRADDKTLTPSFLYYLEGYGLVLVLAVAGLIWLAGAVRRREPLGERLLPMVWAFVGFVLPCLPFAFQRKLILGLHLPLAFLAAVAAVTLVRWLSGRMMPVSNQYADGSRRARREASPAMPDPRFATAMAVALVLVTVPTNLCAIQWDFKQALFPETGPGQLATFVRQTDLEALDWARRSLPHDDIIMCAPPGGLMIPAFAGRPVYAGHWSETPHELDRVNECLTFYREASPVKRRSFLAKHAIRYVFFGPSERQVGLPDLAGDAHLRRVYDRGGTQIYEVLPETTASTPERGMGIAERDGRRADHARPVGAS